MFYTNDWQFQQFNLGSAPSMISDVLHINIYAEYEEMWLDYLYFDEVDNTVESIDSEHLIHDMPFTNLSEDIEIQYSRRHGHRIASYTEETYQIIAFQLRNGLWFRIDFGRRDSMDIQEFQPEDEAIIMQMIDSILLNNRRSYNEPINLVIPPE
jgi:hypothetical protein